MRDMVPLARVVQIARPSIVSLVKYRIPSYALRLLFRGHYPTESIICITITSIGTIPISGSFVRRKIRCIRSYVRRIPRECSSSHSCTSFTWSRASLMEDMSSSMVECGKDILYERSWMPPYRLWYPVPLLVCCGTLWALPTLPSSVWAHGWS